MYVPPKQSHENGRFVLKHRNLFCFARVVIQQCHGPFSGIEATFRANYPWWSMVTWHFMPAVLGMTSNTTRKTSHSPFAVSSCVSYQQASWCATQEESHTIKKKAFARWAWLNACCLWPDYHSYQKVLFFSGFVCQFRVAQSFCLSHHHQKGPPGFWTKLEWVAGFWMSLQLHAIR